jgi:hypothetical protein
MPIQVKRFNWVNRPTRWQHAEAWRAQRKQMTERFLDDSSVASSAFLSAQQNLSVGMASLAAQASIARAQNEIKAVQSRFAAAAGSIDRLV